MSNSQLNKLKLVIKNGTEVTLKVSSNVVPDFKDENNFPNKLLLTKTQFSKLSKAVSNNSSDNATLSKTQLHKIGQSGGFLVTLLGPLLTTGLHLMNNVLKSLAKDILIPLGLTAAASATDVAIYNKMFGSGVTTLIISNEEMNDIMTIVKSLEESGLLIKDVSETIKNEAKEHKGRIFIMLFGTIGASLLGNLLTGKETIRAGEGTIRRGQNI